MLGHIFKIISFYLIYKSIIEKSIKEPHRSLFLGLQNQVNNDGLTGLFNHRYLYEKLEEEIKSMLRSDAPLSIILLDIDYFKKINDQHGHTVGDEALKGIRATIKGLIRSTDIAGRYGGEEFMVILPDTNLEDTYQVAEKIRTGIEEEVYCTKNIKITISAGIAQFAENINKAEVHDYLKLVNSFVNVADGNLYQAKASGRNLTVGGNIAVEDK